MDFDIREIREFYDSKTQDYEFNKLVNFGVTKNFLDWLDAF